MVITCKQDLVCFVVSAILETCNRFVHLTASSDRPLDVGKHAEDILCLYPQFIRNSFVSFAMNSGLQSFNSSLGTTNVTNSFLKDLHKRHL